LLKKTDCLYTIAKILNCFYDIYCDEVLDKIFIQKDIYKILKNGEKSLLRSFQKYKDEECFEGFDILERKDYIKETLENLKSFLVYKLYNLI